MRPGDEFIQRDRDQHPPAHTPVYKSSVLRSPHLAFWSLQNSFSETIVPWFGHGQLDLRDNDLILNHSQGGEAIGERMVVHGRVLDENGRGIPDTLVEIWQANAAGKSDHPADRQDKSLDPVFHSWSRAGTDFAAGLYAFETVKPGIVEGRYGRPMAPHVNVLVDEGLMSDCPHVQFVMGVRNAIPAEEHLLDLLLGEMRIVLPRATWTAAGIGRNQAVVMDWALARGAQAVRTGLEDNVRISRDRLAGSNAELVRLAADAVARHGGPVATPAQVRALLGLRP